MDLKEILYRVSNSDEVAFRQLFENFFPGLLSYSTSILKDRSLAEEVVTDVFVGVWERRSSVLMVRNVSFYLYKSVRYASMKALIKQKKYTSLSLDEAGDYFSFSCTPTGSSLVSKENCRKISEAISRLPPRCRLIFRLVKEEGMKYKEVSRLLNLSEKTIENQMTIALKKLIDKLDETLPEFRNYFSFNSCRYKSRKPETAD